MKELVENKDIHNKIVCWWSGGITSAVACKIALGLFGEDNCIVVFIDTYNEHPDTYRFMEDCQKWYGADIWTISNKKYSCIQDVWYDKLSLNVATGAICSSELKRAVRIRFQKKYHPSTQVFGFDIDEPKRAKNMKKNYDKMNPIFPLLLYGLTKKHCIDIVKNEGIEIPDMYKLGFSNNNCWVTGCVQGGIGYWQKMEREFPDKFEAMANIEHDLTNLKGSPVTCLKDQSKAAKESGQFHVFLKPHPDYPFYKDISMMEGREPENLMECNGFCGIQGELFQQL